MEIYSCVGQFAMSKNSGQNNFIQSICSPKHALSIGMLSLVKWICDILQEHGTKIVQQ